MRSSTLPLQDVFERDGALLRALAFDGHGPGLTRPKPGSVPRRVVLLRTEFVEVVVGRDLFPGVGRLVRAERAADGCQPAAVGCWLLRGCVARHESGARCRREGGDERAAIA